MVSRIPSSIGPQGEKDDDDLERERKLEEAVSGQQAIDDVDEASMESFPASDPPGYTECHA